MNKFGGLYKLNIAEDQDSAAIGMKEEDLRPALLRLASDYVYFANASVNDSGTVVTHDRISHSDPTLWNTEVKRRVEFKGDTLVLQVVEAKRRLK